MCGSPGRRGLGDVVRRAGDDVHKGDLLFPAGTELPAPAVVGVLASVGCGVGARRLVPAPRRRAVDGGRELVGGRRPMLGPGQDQGEQPDRMLPRPAVGLGRLRADRPRPSSVTGRERPWKPSWPRPGSGATPW